MIYQIQVLELKRFKSRIDLLNTSTALFRTRPARCTVLVDRGHVRHDRWCVCVCVTSGLLLVGWFLEYMYDVSQHAGARYLTSGLEHCRYISEGSLFDTRCQQDLDTYTKLNSYSSDALSGSVRIPLYSLRKAQTLPQSGKNRGPANLSSHLLQVEVLGPCNIAATLKDKWHSTSSKNPYFVVYRTRSWNECKSSVLSEIDALCRLFREHWPH